MDLAALILSVAALLVSLYQWLRDNSRQKKEATINAFQHLQNDVFQGLKDLLSECEGNTEHIVRSSEAWKKATDFLSRIEHFSVGVNTGVYSLKILNRLAGGYFIRTFETLEPVILKKRAYNSSGGRHYDEFESVVQDLKKLRKEKSQG